MVIYGYKGFKGQYHKCFFNQMENHMLITWKIEIEPRKEINA